MVIDKVYLEEARRIRQVYLKNMHEINKRVPFINQYKEKIGYYTTTIQEIVDSGASEMEKQTKLFAEMELLKKDIDALEYEIQPFYKEIQLLTESSHKLLVAIKEKYMGIKKKEIEDQIYPYISDLY